MQQVQQLFLWLALWLNPAPNLPEVTSDDITRFPNAECTKENLEFAEAHLLFLREAGHEALRTDHWKEAVEFTRTWSHLHYAHENAIHNPFLNHDMICLREILGPARYYRGEMPPAVPVWRFRQF